MTAKSPPGNRYRPGSGMQRVWEVFEAQGAQAALAFGQSLELADSSLKKWIRTWTKDQGSEAQAQELADVLIQCDSQHDIPPGKELEVARKIVANESKQRKIKPNGKRLVTVSWAQDDITHLVQLGEQQSEIHFSSRGINQFISNEQWSYKEEEV